MSTEINLEQLKKEIREMKPTYRLFLVLKEELTKIGHWKKLARGDPMKGYLARGTKGDKEE